jgi:hypothetical protein
VSTATAATLLETRYRRVLRLLPPGYRAVWEDDMVGSLLDARGVDGTDTEAAVLAGLGTPGPAEVLSVLWLAVRARLGVFGATPRQLVWGEAARKLALVGLLVAAADVLARALWDVAVLHHLPQAQFSTLANPDWLLTGPWHRLLGTAPLLWVPAFVALVLGRRRVATGLAVLAVLPEVVRTLLDISGFPGQTPSQLGYLVARVLPVVALIAFHERAPAPRRRPWLMALAVATAVLSLPAALLVRGSGPLPPPTWAQLIFLDWAGVCALAAVTVTVVHLLARRRGRPFGSPGWTLALAVVAAVALLQRALSLADYVRLSGEQPAYRVFEVAATLEVVLVAVATVVLAGLARADRPESHDGPAPVRGAGPSVAG